MHPLLMGHACTRGEALTLMHSLLMGHACTRGVALTHVHPFLIDHACTRGEALTRIRAVARMVWCLAAAPVQACLRVAPAPIHHASALLSVACGP